MQDLCSQEKPQLNVALNPETSGSLSSCSSGSAGITTPKVSLMLFWILGNLSWPQ